MVQTFGKKRNAIAVATVRAGKGKFIYIHIILGVVKVNGSPIDLVEPAPLRTKAIEPLLLLGNKRTGRLDIRVKVRGGGGAAQIYAIRQVH